MSRLDAESIRGALGECTIGREIVVLDETTSTNDAVLQRAVSKRVVGEADSFPSEGLVIFAEHQTAGRGQRANLWESATHKGLWFSILLRPKIDIGESARLTKWAAETVAQTIREEFSVTPTIKPPNDIQIEGRKVAGVLVEMRAQPNAPHLAIAGIGINVNHAAEDFSEELQETAISLAMAAKKQVDRNKFAVALLRDLDRSYDAMFG